MFTDEELGSIKHLNDLYRDLKRVILFVESLDPKNASNIQVIKELRDSYDHIQSILRFKYEPEGNENGDYFKSNIDKALGHIYRAYFDSLDSSYIIMKADLFEYLEKYTASIRHKGIPGYAEKRAELIEMQTKMGVLRGKKDSGIDLSPIFSEYIVELNKFEKLKKYFFGQKDVLDDLYEEQKDDDRKANLLMKKSTKQLWITGIVFVVLGVFLGWFVTTFFNRPSKVTQPQQKEAPANQDSSLRKK
jgi:hypothetical protein